MKLAQLAQLELTDEEISDLKKDLNHILTWVEKLKEVDTTGVPPLVSPCAETTVLREDEPGPHLQREEALQRAPQADEQFILVPKVIT
jgi:aspartyl-tRNA(Asn)/glutamyl-tRNA(Gln) amidotransferase subunit C